MNQLLLALLSALFISCPAFAQKPDSARLMVHYKFSHLRDTTQKDKPYTENMMLLAGKSASVYKSFDSKQATAAFKKQIMEQAGSGRNSINVQSRGTREEYFQFPNEHKFIRKEKLITTYLIDEPFPVINWKISNDTLSIGGLHCQKATGRFKGRDYTAWFCADLPYRSGPWKLNGLPGLIIDAYDSRKEVVFKFDGIEQISKTDKPVRDNSPQLSGVSIITVGVDDSDDSAIIALPDNGVKTTEKELANLREAMRKDPNAFIQSAMAGSGFNLKPNANVTVRTVPGYTRPVNNNPIELPEKK